jgi:hypothetical protein
MGQSCPDRSSESLKKGALLMSEENNTPQEARPLPVFNLGTQEQLNTNARNPDASRFEVERVKVNCAYFWPGHNFHWIPLLRHSEPRIPVEATWLEANAFEVKVEGRTEIWYHHDPERLKDALAKCRKSDVKATQGRPWLFINHGTGSYAFNCARAELQVCMGRS